MPVPQPRPRRLPPRRLANTSQHLVPWQRAVVRAFGFAAFLFVAFVLLGLGVSWVYAAIAAAVAWLVMAAIIRGAF